MTSEATTERQTSNAIEAFIQANKAGARLQASYRGMGFYWSPKGKPPRLYVWRTLKDGALGWRLASIGG